MKNTFLILIAVFFTETTFSQLSFLVLNENNSAVDGAHIFRNKKLIGYTSKEGKFSMPDIPLGDTVFFKLNDITAYHVVSIQTRKMTQKVILYSEGVLEAKQYNLEGGDFFDPMDPVAVPMEEPLAHDKTYDAAEVEQQAEFPGGKTAMNKYLAENMKYPEIAIKNGLQGKCYLKFVVEINGQITDVKVIRGLPDCPECDAEAKRVVRLFPKWKTAKVNGSAVRSYYTLPFTFKID